jgi:hypothetical protein
MALQAGDLNATQGMALAIYTEINAALGGDLTPDALTAVQPSWKKLSYAVAAGVINHLKRDPLTDPDFAQVVSARTGDPAYWDWLGGFVQVFSSWTPAGTDGTALKGALTAFLGGHPVPTELTGSLQ